MAWFLITFLALLSLAGFGFFVRQTVSGLAITGLRDNFSWGLYIQLFLYLSAIAGGIIIFIAIISLLEIRELYLTARIGAIASFSCLLCAGMIIAADLGKPFRFFKLLTGKKLNSPLTWDFYLLTICMALNLVYLFDIAKAGRTFQIIWGFLSISAALLFVMVHTLFFIARMEARHQSQPFLGIKTISNSVSAGIALTTLIAIFVRVASNYISTILIVSTAFTFAALVAEKIASDSEINGHAENKSIGIVINAAVLALLFAARMADLYEPVLLMPACILILWHVFADKLQILKSNQNLPALPLPISQFDRIAIYRPSRDELLLSIGVLSFCALVIITLMKNMILK